MSASAFQRVEVTDLSQNDIIIVLMGPTGSGKSTFINQACGGAYADGVGNGLTTFTKTVCGVRGQYDGRSVAFIDTPGWNDTADASLDEKRVLREIDNWLKLSFQKKLRLSGIIYTHNIKTSRQSQPHDRAIRMFHKICGRALANAVLVTTHWAGGKPEDKERRERELSSMVWKPLIKDGATMRRFDNTTESAWEACQPLLVDQSQDIQVPQELLESGIESTPGDGKEPILERTRRMLAALFRRPRRVPS